MCSERTRFSVSWKSVGDGVSEQEKTYFIDALERGFTHYGFKLKIAMFRLEVIWSLSCVFWIHIGKRIRLEQHYELLYMGL